MQKKLSLITILLCLSIKLFGGDNPRASILICGNGNDLYSIFGHSAIRIKCDTSDIVYNFGTFDFDTPDFGAKFIKGNLNYFLSKDNFNNFLQDYVSERRSVVEYPILINPAEILRLKNSLETTCNNVIYRTYKYQFLKDNCATRIYTLLKNNVHSYNWPLKSYQTSFRSSLNQNLKNNPMTRLGINILLGSLGEIKLNSASNSFLPDSLASELSHASSKANGRSLLSGRAIIFTGLPKKNNSYFKEVLLVIAITLLMILTKLRSQAILGLFIGVLLLGLMLFSFREEFKFNYCIFIFNPLDILLICRIPRFKNRLLLASLILNVIYTLIYFFLNINYPPLLILNIFILIYKLKIYSITEHAKSLVK